MKDSSSLPLLFVFSLMMIWGTFFHDFAITLREPRGRRRKEGHFPDRRRGGGKRRKKGSRRGQIEREKNVFGIFMLSSFYYYSRACSSSSNILLCVATVETNRINIKQNGTTYLLWWRHSCTCWRTPRLMALIFQFWFLEQAIGERRRATCTASSREKKKPAVGFVMRSRQPATSDEVWRRSLEAEFAEEQERRRDVRREALRGRGPGNGTLLPDPLASRNFRVSPKISRI